MRDDLGCLRLHLERRPRSFSRSWPAWLAVLAFACDSDGGAPGAGGASAGAAGKQPVDGAPTGGSTGTGGAGAAGGSGAPGGASASGGSGASSGDASGGSGAAAGAADGGIADASDCSELGLCLRCCCAEFLACTSTACGEQVRCVEDCVQVAVLEGRLVDATTVAACKRECAPNGQLDLSAQYLVDCQYGRCRSTCVY